MVEVDSLTLNIHNIHVSMIIHRYNASSIKQTLKPKYTITAHNDVDQKAFWSTSLWAPDYNYILNLVSMVGK